MERKNKRNQYRRVVVSLILGAMFLTGCGGEYADTGANRGVSGNAVSGEVVSGSAVSEENATETKFSAEKHQYCTDTNLYLATEKGIAQYRLDGTHKKMLTEIEEEDDLEEWVKYVDSNFLYYTEEKTILYRVPIEKDASGYDVVEMSKREKVLQDDLWGIYVDSDYCIYTTVEGGLVKVDLRKKKKVSEVNDFLPDNLIYIFRTQDSYILMEDYTDFIYTQAVDDTEWKRFRCPSGKLHVQMHQEDADDVYYSLPGSDDDKYNRFYGRQVKRINARQRKTTSFVTEKELGQEVKEAVKLDDEKDALSYFYIVNLFIQQKRVYLMVEAGRENNNVFYMENLIFSKGRGDSELRFEQKLTECMHAQNTKRTGEWRLTDGRSFKGTVVYDDASCLQMVDGKAYLYCYDYEKKKSRVGCYELASGRFWWIKEGDADHTALLYDYHDQNFEDVFDHWHKGRLTGRPPADELFVGEFCEKEE